MLTVGNMSEETLTTISPTTNKAVLTRHGATKEDVDALTKNAAEAFKTFSRDTSFPQRKKIVKKALELITERQDDLARELTEQMGRPIAYTAKEITTAVARGEYLVKMSDDALKDTDGEPEQGFRRYIRKMPIGTVLIIFAWNVSSGTLIDIERNLCCC